MIRPPREAATKYLRDAAAGYSFAYNNHDIDRLAAFVEARDREWVETCEYEALLAGNPCGHDPCSHSTCTTARSAAARIRALIPKEAP